MGRTETGQGSTIQIMTDGRLLCTKKLPVRLGGEMSMGIVHKPEWGMTVLRYPGTENGDGNPALKELREFLNRPGWEVRLVVITLSDKWKVSIVSSDKRARESEVSDIEDVQLLVSGRDLTDFQSIIEFLGYLKYKFATSPIAPRADGRGGA